MTPFELLAETLGRVGEVRVGPESLCGHAVHMELRTSRAVVTAVGKGLGGSLWKSAWFELLEHAVYEEFIGPSAPASDRQPAELHGDSGRYAQDVVALLELDAETATPALCYSVLGSPEKVWIPVAKGASRPTLRQIYFGSTTGWAAGSSQAETLVHAIFEIIERDALSRLYGATLAGVLHGESFMAEGELGDLVVHVAERCGTPVCLRRLPSLGSPNVATVVAVSERLDKFERPILGSGTSFDLHSAALRALLELDQEIFAEDQSLPYENDSPYLATGYLHSYPQLLMASKLSAWKPERDLGYIRTSISWKPRDPVERLLACLNSTILYRVVWEGPGGVVIEAQIPGTERLHMLRHGIPIEPIASLRHPNVLAKCRERSL